MAKIPLKIKEFNDLVRYRKRRDDIGDDFFLKHDIISPSVRCDKNRPGMHLVRSRIPILEEYKDVVYGIAKLSETSKLLGDVRGKKQVIYLEETDSGIWVTVNDLCLQLAGVYSGEDADVAMDFCPQYEWFDDCLRTHDWVELDQTDLMRIKLGGVMTLEDDRETTYVRIARDLFKLRGTGRLDSPVDYTAQYHINSPKSTQDVIVIGSNLHGILDIHVTYPFIECVHSYVFDPFH